MYCTGRLQSRRPLRNIADEDLQNLTWTWAKTNPEWQLPKREEAKY